MECALAGGISYHALTAGAAGTFVAQIQIARIAAVGTATAASSAAAALIPSKRFCQFL